MGLLKWFLYLMMTMMMTGTGDPAAAAPAGKDAWRTLCERGGLQREIRVRYDPQISETACHVRYRKGWIRRTLWRAEYDVSSCFHQAGDLVKRLRGWGWECRQTAGQPLTRRRM